MKQKTTKRIFSLLYCSLCSFFAVAQTLWYNTPADEWMKSLPVANGRLGAMIYGGPQTERIALNESSMWSGGENPEQNKPYGKEGLDTLRQYFFRGELDKGNDLCQKYLTGNEMDFGSHVPFGDVVIHFLKQESASLLSYRRSLDLTTAISDVDYKQNETQYHREYFCSHPQDVLVARYTVSKPGSLSFNLEMSLLRPESKVAFNGNKVEVTGIASQPGRTDKGVRFKAIMKVLTKGGHVTNKGDHMEVRGADEVIILADLRTDYRCPNYEQLCENTIAKAEASTFDTMRKEHIADYSSLFERVHLSLGNKKMEQYPTDQRWLAVKQGMDDPALQALFIQYGRYLTIISSREDSPLPIALQGLFNDNLACNMGWNSDYHLDINTEQNYWLTNIGNLAECNAPLDRYIADLARHGAETARVIYGCNGWTAHCTANIWGFTAPAGCIAWGLFITGGSWMATHLWTHFEYTGDTEYLRNTAYPLLKSNALFLLDMMCEDPNTGYLVTGPSISPENSFGWKDKRICASMMPTVDLVLTREILEDCLKSTEILNTDHEFASQLRSAIDKLPPLRANKYGGLREWLEDYDDVNVNHRHTSHLLALYPYYQITTEKTPELAEASYQTILRRINAEDWEDVEWSRAWALCNYARLHKSELAYESLNQLIGSLSRENFFTISPKGIAGAPWDIFVIDGNMAGAAGALEMLVQSHEGYVEFLPTLPQAWKEGSFSGLCVRGGAEVSAQWKDGKVLKANLTATCNGTFRIKAPQNLKKFSANGKSLTPDSHGIITVTLKKGEIIHMK